MRNAMTKYLQWNVQTLVQALVLEVRTIVVSDRMASGVQIINDFHLTLSRAVYDMPNIVGRQARAVNLNVPESE
jgi:hypothetical protein